MNRTSHCMIHNSIYYNIIITNKRRFSTSLLFILFYFILVQLLCIEDIEKPVAKLWEVHAVHRHSKRLPKGVYAERLSTRCSSQPCAMDSTILIVISKDANYALVVRKIIDDAPPTFVGVEAGIHSNDHIGWT